MIPAPALTLRIAREIDLVLAFLPWLPRPGVTLDATPGATPNLYYRWNEREQAPYLVVPPAWDSDDAALRRLVRHECGHLWADALGRRRGGSYDVYPDLGIDGTHPQRHEIAAEILARVMGEGVSYPELEPLSRPTPERIAFVTRSGELPDRLAEAIEVDRAIAAFWERTDIPQFFRDYMPNWQRYLDLYILAPLRTKR